MDNISLVEKNTNLARILQDLARQCIFLAGFFQDSCKIYLILQDSCKIDLILQNSCKMKLLLARILQDMPYLNCVQHVPISPRSMLQPRYYITIIKCLKRFEFSVLSFRVLSFLVLSFLVIH